MQSVQMHASQTLPRNGAFTASRPARAARRLARIDRRQAQVQNAVKEVFMPALSSTMTEGRIVSWLKNAGDKVAKGEPIVVVESDKADMEVESFSEGILAAVVVDVNGRANVGAPIAFVAESEGDVAEAKKKAASFGGAPAASSNGTAAAVAAPAPAPAPVAAPAPKAAAPPPPPPPAPVAAAPAPAPVKRADGRIVATPYAKQLAKELKVDLASIAGSGPNGRITASDVEAAAGRGPAAPAAAPAPAGAAAPAPAPKAASAAPAPAAGKGTTVSELRGTTKPFTALEAAVSRNMIESLKVPEFRVSMSIHTDKLDALYQKLKPKGVTMTALLAKACGVALARHPVMFAACTPDGNGITYSETVNVSVAVAMNDGGLITPVLKNADKTDIYQMSRDWADLVKRARDKKLKPEEFNSGNFSISNLGMFGVDTFDAILPPGQAGILAVAASKPTVVANEDGMIGVKKVMVVNLTADHRIVYGAQAAEFLLSLKSIIEAPDQLVF